MNIPSRIGKPALLAGIFAFAVASALAEEPILTFGSKSATAGKGKPAGAAAEAIGMTELDDSIVITSPNFWSTQVQYENITMDTATAVPEKFLTVEIKGTVTGKNPKLRLVLIGPGWGSKSIWHFDLSEVSPDGYTVVKSTTPLSEPAEPNEGQPLQVGGPVSALQILTAAEATDKPWSLEIKSVGLAD